MRIEKLSLSGNSPRVQRKPVPGEVRGREIQQGENYQGAVEANRNIDFTEPERQDPRHSPRLL